MNKTFLIIITLLFNVICLFAQDKKEKKDEKTPVYNYVIDDPMDAFSHLDANNRAYIYVPEFYSSTPSKVMDTTYSFECYDARDSIVKSTHIQDIKDIHFISMFKSYPDKEHMYTDAYGVRKPLPISSIVKRYDRVGEDQWMSIDYKTNRYTKLKESRTYIVRTDTLIISNPITHKDESLIYCYYKVEPIK